MRSTLTTLAVGFILGATLGFAGLWTQVIQPAKEQITELETEHGVMQSALDSATDALTKAARELRGEVTPAGASTEIGLGPTPVPDPAAPLQPKPLPVPEPQPASGTRTSTRTIQIATELDNVAEKLRSARQQPRRR